MYFKRRITIAYYTCFLQGTVLLSLHLFVLSIYFVYVNVNIDLYQQMLSHTSMCGKLISFTHF